MQCCDRGLVKRGDVVGFQHLCTRAVRLTSVKLVHLSLIGAAAHMFGQVLPHAELGGIHIMSARRPKTVRVTGQDRQQAGNQFGMSRRGLLYKR